MSTWFEITVKYVKVDEQGREKKASEVYLLDAVSFTEAEARIHKELEKMISGEFSVRKIAITNISEIIPDGNGDRWFKCKIAFITVDENSGKEKRICQNILVSADSVEEADKLAKEAMSGMMADFEIKSISESSILDVFPYVFPETKAEILKKDFIPVDDSIPVDEETN